MTGSPFATIPCVRPEGSQMSRRAAISALMGIDMKTMCTRCILVLLLCVTACSVLSGRELPGLCVRDGVLSMGSRPYRGMGVNCFSLLSRTLKDPSDRSYEEGLARLSEVGIPFVRFMCGGFWPVDWDLYRQDKDAYFRRLDRIVECAEANRIGLIPSLFWHVSTVSDIVGEPVDQLGDAHSRSAAFIRQYTREVVTRYRGSPAIWGWEFGNEYNLAVDLPNAAEHRPPVWPGLGTAASRSERDELSSAHMLTAFDQFASTVRLCDPHRIIITGNSLPRSSAYHNSHEKSWVQDSPAQWESILLRDNPDPFDTLSVHLYPDEAGRYPAQARDLEGLIEAMQTMSRRAGKPLFIGEFGVPSQAGSQAQCAAFGELVMAIETQDVPLSAVWVFDFPGQDGTWNITFENERALMLSLVAQANRRMGLNNR